LCIPDRRLTCNIHVYTVYVIMDEALSLFVGF
jgi:hypothetical protein